jgi:hypothetical protein
MYVYLAPSIFAGALFQAQQAPYLATIAKKRWSSHAQITVCEPSEIVHHSLKQTAGMAMSPFGYKLLCCTKKLVAAFACLRSDSYGRGGLAPSRTHFLQIRITFDTFSLIFMARKLLTTIYYSSGELQLGKGRGEQKQ